MLDNHSVKVKLTTTIIYTPVMNGQHGWQGHSYIQTYTCTPT